ncbi:MAG: phosphotransferase [Planctomycetota bacterium]|nr:phosphotransferase [Planctomycetota bacterium]
MTIYSGSLPNQLLRMDSFLAGPSSEPVPENMTMIPSHWLKKRAGNVIFKIQEGGETTIAKVYLPRKNLWREHWKRVSHRFFECKRGVTPTARCETEALALKLWSENGFRVPQVVESLEQFHIQFAPMLLMEFIEGETLHHFLTSPRPREAQKLDAVEALGALHGRRHKRALELKEPLLIQEHSTTKHILMNDSELITFDLEHGFANSYPVLSAMTEELSSTTRSLIRDLPNNPEVLKRYVAGYAGTDLLRQICAEFFSMKLRRIIKRKADRSRRNCFSKTEGMLQLQSIATQS